MVIFKKDFSSNQFKELEYLYREAIISLKKLNVIFPQYVSVWDLVQKKLTIIKMTIDSLDLPTETMKRDADISTLLNFELRDLEDKNLSSLFKLDRAYTLFGMKDISFEFKIR